jgi:hypothetical protein
MFSKRETKTMSEGTLTGSLLGDGAGSVEAPGATTSDGLKIKTLPPSVVKDIEQKNIARRLAGLSPIVIKVRRCIACGAPFESAGNRTCGCSSRTAGTIAGREII